jgi:hypothetical protein
LSGTGSSEFGGASAGTGGYNQREGPACLRGVLARSSIEVAQRLTVIAVTIEDDIAAEVTAMGWVPVEGEDGARIWVRSKDIGVDNAPYRDTALEVVRTYTH